MDLLTNLALGFGVAVSPINLLYAFVGCIVGTLIGVPPGIGPVATIFFAWLLLGESVSWEQILGGVFVLSGVMLVSSKKA